MFAFGFWPRANCRRVGVGGRAGWRRRPAVRAWGVILVCAVASGMFCGTAATCGATRDSNQKSMQQAIDAVPFDKLNVQAQGKLWDVMSKPSLYRQLPVTVIQSDPDLYLTMIRHPEIVVNMWQLMGVTRVTMQRTGDFTLDAADGAGTVCNVELVYGDRNTHVFYSEGTYEGKLLRNLIRGRCVMVLQSEYKSTEDQRVYVTSRLDMFVQFDNVGAEILAKTLHPLVGKSADHNFTESTKFLGQVASAAERKTVGLQRLSQRLNNVDVAIREKFTSATATAHQRAALRDSGKKIWEADLTSAVQPAPVVTTQRGQQGATNLLRTAPQGKTISLRH